MIVPVAPRNSSAPDELTTIWSEPVSMTVEPGTATIHVSLTEIICGPLGTSSGAGGVVLPSSRSYAIESWSGPTASTVHANTNGTVPELQSTGPVGVTDVSVT